MRVLHFLHLAGLASLVASLFTPPNTSVTSKSRPMNTMLLSSLVLLVLTPSVHATDRDYWWDKRSSPRKPLHQAITTRSDPTDNNWQKGPGEVKLCKANGCIPISANGKCVVFPEKSTDKLLWIQQDQGSTCLYYMHDKICDKADPQLVTRSYTGMEYVCVGDECTGVNSVICKDSSSKGEDEGALKHVDTRSEDPFTDVVAMPGESKIDEPDQLSLCNDTWQGMQCNHISANNKCVVFPETTANILMWIGQYEGVVCKYYLRDQRCDIDNPAHVVSTIGGYLQACIGAECSGIHSAICKDKWWPGTEHVESPEPSQQPEPPKFRQMVESSLPDDRLTTRAENINLDGPGETVICEKTWGDGRCDTLSVNNACVNIPEGLAHRVGSVYQAQGSICKYFDGPCPVSSPTIALNSHRHPVGMILSQSLGSKIGYLMCRDQWTAGRDDPGLQPSGTQPFVMHMNGEDSDENLASVKHLLNDQASTSTASHLLMCNSKDFQGLCLGASQSNSCTRAAIEIKSFAIERGTQCIFYSEPDCQSNNGPPHYEGSNAGERRLADVDYPIQSFQCRQAPARRSSTLPKLYASQAAPADTQYSPLQICHDVGMKGLCFAYVGPGCLPNPFNVDAIESYTMDQGYECAFYPYHNCDGNVRGPPHYDNSKTGPKRVDDTDWDIWSISCYPSPFIANGTSSQEIDT